MAEEFKKFYAPDWIKGVRGGLSKEAFAKIIGVSVRHYYRYESGEKQIPQWVVDAVNKYIHDISPGIEDPKRPYAPHGDWKPSLTTEEFVGIPRGLGMGRAMDLLGVIYASRDETLIRAIYSNLHAFAQVVAEREKRNQLESTLETLRSETDSLRKEVAELKSVLQAQVRAITLAAHIGCRPGGETLRITWDDVNFSTNTITVTSARKGGIAKRSVFIHPNLLTKLELWREQDRQDKIKTKHIIHYRNKPVERLKNSWWGALDRAGIRPWLKKKKLAKFNSRKGERRRLRMYDLRHLFVTMALDSGSDAGTVAAIIGSSPNTIMRHYRHVSIAAQRKTIMQVDPLNPKK